VPREAFWTFLFVYMRLRELFGRVVRLVHRQRLLEQGSTDRRLGDSRRAGPKTGPGPLMTWRLWTGDDADAELIRVTGREKMQVIDHVVVTAHE
jgi:hypothetical protein